MLGSIAGALIGGWSSRRKAKRANAMLNEATRIQNEAIDKNRGILASGFENARNQIDDIAQRGDVAYNDLMRMQGSREEVGNIGTEGVMDIQGQRGDPNEVLSFAQQRANQMQARTGMMGQRNLNRLPVGGVDQNRFQTNSSYNLQEDQLAAGRMGIEGVAGTLANGVDPNQFVSGQSRAQMDRQFDLGQQGADIMQGAATLDQDRFLDPQSRSAINQQFRQGQQGEGVINNALNLDQNRFRTGQQSQMIDTQYQAGQAGIQGVMDASGPVDQNRFLSRGQQGFVRDATRTGRQGLNVLRQASGELDINKFLDPSMAFQIQEGSRAIQDSAAARGGLGSGASLKGLTRFSQGLASQSFNNAVQQAQADKSRLASVGQIMAGQATAGADISRQGTQLALAEQGQRGQLASQLIGQGQMAFGNEAALTDQALRGQGQDFSMGQFLTNLGSQGISNRNAFTGLSLNARGQDLSAGGQFLDAGRSAMDSERAFTSQAQQQFGQDLAGYNQLAGYGQQGFGNVTDMARLGLADNQNTFSQGLQKATTQIGLGSQSVADRLNATQIANTGLDRDLRASALLMGQGDAAFTNAGQLNQFGNATRTALGNLALQDAETQANFNASQAQLNAARVLGQQDKLGATISGAMAGLGSATTGLTQLGSTMASGGGGGGLNLGSLGSLASAAMSFFSDEDVKKGKRNLSDEEVDEFAAHLTGKSFRYNKRGEAIGMNSDRRAGVMAQDLEKTAIGKPLVKKDANGTRMIDVPQSVGALMAVVANQGNRLQKLEGKRKR